MKRDFAFTLIELLVVITIILVLMSMLMPALSQVRAKGKSMQCLSNLKQIGSAYWVYADDNGGQANDTVRTSNWIYGPIYASDQHLTLCPYLNIKPVSYSAAESGPCHPLVLCAEGRIDGTTTNPRRENGTPNPSYTTNYYFRTSAGPGNSKYCSKLSSVKIPSIRIVCSDGTSVINSTVGPGSMYSNYHIARRHFKGGNIVFLDGHATWLSDAKIFEMGTGPDAVNEHWHN